MLRWNSYRRVLPRFYGHLVTAHNGPGEVSWPEAEVFSGVQARSGGDAAVPRCERQLDRRRTGD